ncbi:putative TspO/MBR-related protein precursor [Actinoplanes lobatus]|uniref:Tryptophan-rich sensory protein n=1 Tax=Actinoplanes lobatus TaxID=113568 RepID=A0A7W7HKU7_9ACTN|nr:TspO/MBR family protein [Actinoplanes lobatus]MBB4752349.1 tryptophan-rich sensory protein [Actinoplanes lobatus]GGN94804.1 putative TspO/MBR-related protein precursor [Actinoplanes lobatus]GIE45604.1 putative TspO/MBR-related protein precursor [Actinoplanes lobatus]
MSSHAADRSGPSHGSLWSLLAFAAAVAAAALIGGLGVSGTAAEYQTLDQPSWAPPSWLFGPVWTILYAMIAVAGWLVWRRSGWAPALTAYAIQLVLNALWTPIFFGFGEYGLALIDIGALWVAIGVTVLLFRPISSLAAGLLLPYWGWVTYATALNAVIWHAN